MSQAAQHDPRAGNAVYYDLDADPLSDVPFYLRNVDRNTALLELGCGTGRVLIPLAAHCREIVGVDYSAGMIERCRLKLAKSGQNLAKVTLTVGDITRLDLRRSFDLIIAPYRVMQALETDDEVAGFFATIRKHLAPSGACILNVFNPDRDREELKRSWCKPGEEVRWEKTLLDGTRVVHSEWYERMDQENLVLFPQLIYRRYKGDQLLEEFVQRIKMRCYYPDEFKALIEKQGFTITGSWGGYEGHAYGAGKELILKFSSSNEHCQG
jgi:ubiquinone/menaquinone biosynthesis C-methylase UbiE